MTLDKLLQSNVYQNIVDVTDKIHSLMLVNEEKLYYLEMIKYLISNIPESIPDNVVENGLKSIEKVLTTNFGNANLILTDAIQPYLEITTINPGDNKDKDELIQEQINKSGFNVEKLKIEFNTLNRQKKLNILTSDQALMSWILREKLIPNIKTRLSQYLDTTLEKFNNQIKSALPNFAFILLAPRINHIEKNLVELEAIQIKSKNVLQEIQNDKHQSKTLVSYLATGAIHGHYAAQAKKEEIQANTWRILTIITTCLGIGWLIYVICSGYDLYDNISIDIYQFLLYFLPRGSVTICIIGLAAYFGKQASHHQKNTDFLRKRSFALQGISPYLDDIGKERPEALVISKQKVVEQLLKDCDNSN